MHHGVDITDPAIVAAAELSHRYITDRFLPDKAIDLIDEAAARIRMEIDSKPEAMDRLDRRLIQLKIEREAVKKEKDEASQKRSELAGRGNSETGARIRRSGRNLEGGKIPGAGLPAYQGGDGEGQAGNGSGHAQGRLAESFGAAIWPYSATGSATAIATQQPGGRAKRQGEGRGDKPKLLRTQVGAEEIAEVVSRATGIPVSKMMQGEREKLLQMEQKLHERVVGQDEAVRLVSDAIRRSRAGPCRSQPSLWLVFVPGADRRGQDGVMQGAGRFPVRFRRASDPHRHVGIHGEAFGCPADRGAAGLCRLRGRRLPDRSGAPESLIR